MMFPKLIFTKVILLTLIAYVFTVPCSYDHCYKEELSACRPTDSREHCNSVGGLYVTYREGFASFSKHKCCNFTIADLPRKYFYCVRNIRTKDLKCSSDKSDDYQIKIRTVAGCNKFSCE